MISRSGTVESGEYTGWKIQVVDDTQGETGGFYLILQSSNSEAYDYWFEKKGYLDNQLADYKTKWNSQKQLTLATCRGYLTIPEPTVANNGLKIESNAKHTPGAQGSRPNAGVEPRNSLELFEHSIATKDPKIRLAIDNDGNIHRFFNTSKDGEGNFHWSGSSGDEKNALGNRELRNFNKEIKELKVKK